VRKDLRRDVRTQISLYEVAGSSLGVTESSLGTSDRCHAERRLTVLDATVNALTRSLYATVTPSATTGLPLGLMEPLIISSAPPVAFGIGDMGILLTDGFLEAQTTDGEFFGTPRLVELALKNAHLPAVEIIRALTAAVDDFIRGGPQLDDLTAVIVKRVS